MEQLSEFEVSLKTLQNIENDFLNVIKKHKSLSYHNFLDFLYTPKNKNKKYAVVLEYKGIYYSNIDKNCDFNIIYITQDCCDKFKYCNNYSYIDAARLVDYKNNTEYNFFAEEFKSKEEYLDFKKSAKFYVFKTSSFNKIEILKNYLHTDLSNLNHFRDFCSYAIPVLDSFYGKDYYDIQLLNTGKALKLILKHKPFTITNSEEEERNICGLYTSVELVKGEEGIKIKKVEGFKLEYDLDDLLPGYRHSHLPSISFNLLFTESYYCLGSTDFNVFINSTGNLTEELLELFLYQLQEYLTWENTDDSYINLTTTSDIKIPKNSVESYNNRVDFNITEDTYIVQEYLNFINSLPRFEETITTEDKLDFFNKVKSYLNENNIQPYIQALNEYYDKTEDFYSINHCTAQINLSNVPFKTFRNKPFYTYIPVEELKNYIDEKQKITFSEQSFRKLNEYLSSKAETIYTNSISLSGIDNTIRDNAENFLFV
jgi:hypothetical protein